MDHDLPHEVWFLLAFERFAQAIQQIVDMRTAQVELLQKFLDQNGGRLSQRARARGFAALTEDEIGQIEAAFVETFDRDADAR